MTPENDISEISSIKNVQWKKVRLEVELVNSYVQTVSDVNKNLAGAAITAVDWVCWLVAER